MASRMVSQWNSWPGVKLCQLKFLKLIFSMFVLAQIFSWPECFLAEIAWYADPLEVVWLDMIIYVVGVTFLSKYIANGCCCQLFSTLNLVLTFTHHRFDLLVKLLHVIRSNGIWLESHRSIIWCRGSMLCLVTRWHLMYFAPASKETLI